MSCFPVMLLTVPHLSEAQVTAHLYMFKIIARGDQDPGLAAVGYLTRLGSQVFPLGIRPLKREQTLSL